MNTIVSLYTLRHIFY